jgi:hypothetical protein
LQAWHQESYSSELFLEQEQDTVVVTDGRSAFPRTISRFEGVAATVLGFCSQIRTRQQVLSAAGCDIGTLDSAIEQLEERGLLLSERNRYLTLALRQPGYKRAVRNHEIRNSMRSSYAFLSRQSADAAHA